MSVFYKGEITMSTKRLYKSRNRVLCGVCGGIAEYFNIDPTLVRIIWAILILCFGTGILAYIICALLIPEMPNGTVIVEDRSDSDKY